MEGDSWRRRQHGQPDYSRAYAPSQAPQAVRDSNPHHFRGGSRGGDSDQVRQAQLSATLPPTSASLGAGAGGSQEMEGYAYGPSQLYSNPTMPGTQFQYQPGYLQDQSRQQYAQYQSHMMYEAQQQPQPQSQSSYEPISEYQRSQSRQTAPVDLMANQYGEPQQYYSPDENMTRSGPPAVSEAYVAPYARTQHHLTHTTEPTKTIGRSGLSSTYPTLTTHHTQESEVEVDAEADTLEEHGPNSQGDQLRSYQRALCETNEDTSRGKLREASSSLKQLTKWLLNRAAALGLTKDTKQQPLVYRQRLEMWDNFNNCWLAFLQRQKDNTIDRMATGRPPAAPQSILPPKELVELADELVLLCNGIEKAGLVDYQMGVAEHEIITILYECVDLLEITPSDEEEAPTQSLTSIAGQPSSRSRAR